MTSPTTASGTARRMGWPLAGILLAGLLLRLNGIDFGLPAVYNVDEVAIMSRALAFAKGDLNPHNFLYPTFYFYVLFGWIGGYFAAGYALGLIPSVQAFQSQFFVDPTGVYVAGRVLSVMCGLVTISLVYRLASTCSTRAGGLAAALFLAVSPFAVRDARYVKHDVPATLAVVLASLLLVRAFDRGPAHPQRRRALVLAGLACGAAFSTHYYTVFLVLPLLIVTLADIRDWRRCVADLMVAGGAATAAFFLLSPYLLPELRTALADMSANRAIVIDRASEGGTGLLSGLRIYGGMLWHDAAGWPVVVLAMLGVLLAARTSARRTTLLLSFPAAFLVFIANTVPASRYLNPVLPFVAVFAGVGVSALTGAAGQRHRRLAAVLCLASATPGAWLSLSEGQFFRQTDTRTLALRHIEAHLPPGTSLALQPNSVPLVQSRDSLVEALRANLGDERRASTKFALRLGLNPYPSPAYRTIWIGNGGLDADKIYVRYGELGGAAGLGRLRQLGVTYVVLTRYNNPHPDTVPFLQSLAAEARLVAAFSPFRAGVDAGAEATTQPFLHNTAARITRDLERPGPRLELWQVAAQGPQGRF
jgi:hypothetical protein